MAKEKKPPTVHLIWHRHERHGRQLTRCGRYTMRVYAVADSRMVTCGACLRHTPRG